MSNDASESVENHAKTMNLIRCAFASIYELKIVGLMENKLDTYASLLFYGRNFFSIYMLQCASFASS